MNEDMERNEIAKLDQKRKTIKLGKHLSLVFCPLP
jgi:hypothetical protein